MRIISIWKIYGQLLKMTAVTGKQSIPKVNYNLQIWADVARAAGGIEEKNLPVSSENIEIKFEILDEKFNGNIIES